MFTLGNKESVKSRLKGYYLTSLNVIVHGVEETIEIIEFTLDSHQCDQSD